MIREIKNNACYKIGGYIAIVKGLKNTPNGAPRKEITIAENNGFESMSSKTYIISSYGNDIQCIEQCITKFELDYGFNNYFKRGE